MVTSRSILKTVSKQNAFIPSDLILATFRERAAAGTYAHVAAIDKTGLCRCETRHQNVTALTSSPVVSVNVKKFDGTTATLTATLSTHTINARRFCPTSRRHSSDVTGISIASGGTNAESFEVVAKADRDVSAA